MSASSYASIFDPATGGLHIQLNQAELLTQQQNLWTILSVGLFALGVLGILIVYSSLFIQERMRATRLFNRAFLLIAISSAACLLIDTTLNLPDVTAQLILWQSEVEFRPQGDIHAAAIHAAMAAMAAMIAVVAYLPLSHQLTLRATIILALSIGGVIYPAYLKGVQGLLLHPISQKTVLSVGFEQIGGGTVVTLLATFVAFSGMLVTGLRNSPALPEYILRNTQNYNVLQIKAGAALMAVGGIGFSVGNTSIYSGELGSAIFNVLVAIGVSVLLGVALGFFAPRKVMYPTILLSIIGGLSSVLGNAQHLTVAGIALIALTASAASIAVARIIYARSKTHKVIIYYTSLGIGSLIGLFGFTTALPADHALAGFSLDNLILQAVGALLTILWAFLSGLFLFTAFKYTNQFRQADEIDLNETPIVSTISQMENLIGKLVWHDAKLDERLPVRDSDPQERLASLFNTFLDKLQSDEKRRKIK
ncbi:ammonium transporter [Pseudovibrio sp. WM33]|uniref:ammonium transporter n=1 Tax=Pseudovibrio sp. WM33 TaxID=1735585 RepID=UPI001AD8D622|nr:ammonium transporter [Pseudovibrio sp. WM33]